MRRFILACGLLLAFAGMATAASPATGLVRTNGTTSSTPAPTAASASSGASRSRARARAVTYWSRHVHRFRAGTRRWLTVIRGRPPRDTSRRLSGWSLPGLRRRAKAWRHREHAAWWRANHPPHFAGWLCIHRYEGSWTDSGAPYWGGLQMDLSFQARYGSWLLRHKGTADHWSPLEQIWTAVRAVHRRGFSPWPNTARYCGLA